MAHKDWCEQPCADCKDSCALDESMPCSPDCQALNANGSRDETQCAGCDAIEDNKTIFISLPEYDCPLVGNTISTNYCGAVQQAQRKKGKDLEKCNNCTHNFSSKL